MTLTLMDNGASLAIIILFQADHHPVNVLNVST